MVMLKRQPVEMVPPPEPADFKGEDPDVFYMAATGEIFLDYESYAQRLTFYNQPIFQDELTGKVNLTFFQAVQSEREETVKLHRRFPEALKQPVLRAVQFVITGRLDELIDVVYERFKDRYFIGEAIFIDLQGDKYYARVKDVFAPRALVRWHTQQAEKQASTSAAEFKPPTAAEVVHQIGCDLDRNVEDTVKIDDPEDYIYSIQLVDETGQFTGSLMEVRNKQMSRDRLTFSKAILKKYLRECVVRDSAVGSPWVVRHTLAHRYGIPIAPSQETIDKNNVIKEMKLSKRKRNQEEDTPATPDLSVAETSVAATGAAGKKQKKTKAEKDAEKAQHSTSVIKPQAEEEKVKKKPIKFPIEDLEVDPVSERELKAKIAGEPPRRRDRPVPSKDLGMPVGIFEPLLVTYHFLQAFGKPLMLAPFTLDDYKSALEHNTSEPSCTLLAEIHACLINIIVRDGARSKKLAPSAAAAGKGRAVSAASSNGRAASSEPADDEEEEQEAEEEEESGDELDSREATPAAAAAGKEGEAGGESAELGQIKEEEEDDEDREKNEAIAEVLSAAVSAGRGWENRTLKLDENRQGWEQSLMGVLAKRATAESMPRQIAILSHLTGREHPDGYIDGSFIGDTYSNPRERYPALAFADKVAAIHFLCDLAVMTKAIKTFFDQCEVALTELRKERVELGRQRKRIIEERAAEEQKQSNGGEGDGEGEGNTSKVEEENGGEQNGAGSSGGAAGDEEEEDAPVRPKRGPGRPRGGKNAKKAPSPLPPAEPMDEDEANESEQDELQSSPEPDADSAAEDDDDDDEDASPSKKGQQPRILGSRQQAMLEKKRQRKEEEAARKRELARLREEQKAENLEKKRIQAERVRWEEEEERISKREAAIDLEFRRHHLAPRLRPLGKDRFHDRYWWFDGVGNQSLVGANGQVLYGAGRLFVQGASREDWDAACTDRSIKAMIKRRQEEHGECILDHDEWAVYDDPEQVEQLTAWLRNKGNRENAFKRQLATFKGYLGPGMQKRLEDLDPERSATAAANAAAMAEAEGAHETRRSARKHEQAAMAVGPHNRYLAWTNTHAVK